MGSCHGNRRIGCIFLVNVHCPVERDESGQGTVERLVHLIMCTEVYIRAHSCPLPLSVYVYMCLAICCVALRCALFFSVCSPERWRIRRLVWDYQWVNPLLLLTTQRWLTNIAYTHQHACPQRQHPTRQHTRGRAERISVCT